MKHERFSVASEFFDRVGDGGVVRQDRGRELIAVVVAARLADFRDVDLERYRSNADARQVAHANEIEERDRECLALIERHDRTSVGTIWRRRDAEFLCA